jgi:hypothetical protein
MPRPRSRVRYTFPREIPPSRLAPRVIPSVDPWMAGEMFVSPHVEERRRGFAILFGSEAARRSPLTPQLLAARVDEPDLPLRAQIIQALADYFELRGREYRYPPEVRAMVVGHLRKFERPHLVALLELERARQDGGVKLRPESLIRLMERIPNASPSLTRLAGDRALSIDLRCAAISLIGQVGFTDALTALEGLEARLDGRRAGQMAMTFAPAEHPEEHRLLPALKDALRLLRDNE